MSSTSRLWINYGKQRFKLPTMWLRYHCQCEHCFHQTTGQWIRPAYLAKDCFLIKRATSKISEDALFIEWQDGHESVYSTATLYEDKLKIQNYANLQQAKYSYDFILSREALLDKACINYKHLTNQDTIDALILLLNKYGIVLLTEVPTCKREVLKAAERLAPVMSTIYPKCFDVKIEKTAINIAYTTHALDLHMDLVYYESPPALQLLHCLRFDPEVIGGDSLFLDAFYLAEIFRKKLPKEFATLCFVPVSFEKIHYERLKPVNLVATKPHIICNKNHQVIAVNWAPPFQSKVLIPQQKLNAYYLAYYAFAKMMHTDLGKKGIQLRLEPGELIIFNNRRFLHGRLAFNQVEGVRHLQGAYISNEDYLNACRLAQQRQHSTSLKHIGNVDY